MKLLPDTKCYAFAKLCDHFVYRWRYCKYGLYVLWQKVRNMFTRCQGATKTKSQLKYKMQQEF